VRVLLTGATGLIGSATLAAMHREGHEVVAVARSAGTLRRLPGVAAAVALDLRAATRAQDWLPHLAGIEAVVNCAGVLQDGPGDSTTAVHVEAVGALFAACAQTGVRRIVQVSALGADADAATAFTRSKAAGDAALMASDLDWVVLRPSVVVGRPAYGASALMRALAVLPAVPRLAGAGRLQVVQLDDLVRTILFSLRPEAPVRVAVDVAGPEALTLEEILGAYRRWLLGTRTRLVPVPAALARALFRLGDLAGLLGWRAPVRTTALSELTRGVTADPAPWMALTGIVPRSLADALSAEPASVQERWFARIYFLKPAAIAALALYWITTGLVALGPGWIDAVALVEAAELPYPRLLTLVAALADVAVGAGIALRRTAQPALWAALALSLAYIALSTLLQPVLWADPLGPLVKVVPLMVLNLVALAILDDR
jgi:uncharacterized protein YbjT (DUF2867 family)